MGLFTFWMNWMSQVKTKKLSMNLQLKTNEFQVNFKSMPVGSKLRSTSPRSSPNSRPLGPKSVPVNSNQCPNSNQVGSKSSFEVKTNKSKSRQSILTVLFYPVDAFIYRLYIHDAWPNISKYCLKNRWQLQLTVYQPITIFCTPILYLYSWKSQFLQWFRYDLYDFC